MSSDTAAANTASPNPSPNPATPTTTVAGTIAAARNQIAGTQYIAVADCVDYLLDCRNAAVRPDVKGVITNLLPDFINGNLRPTQSFEEALDQIQMVLQVDAVFDEQLLDADPAH